MVTETGSVFLAEVQRLANAHGGVSAEDARRFLQRFPMQHVFGLLSTGDYTSESVDVICTALDRVLASEVGTEVLPSCSTYVVAALSSDSIQLRKLGAKQLARLLQVLPAGQDTAPLALHLLTALQDPDTGVSSQAEAGLLQFASQQAGFDTLTSSSACGAKLRELLYTSSPTVRIRALALLIKLAAQSQGNLDALRFAGLLDPLLIQLDDSQDVLSCLSTLQLIGEVALSSTAGESCAVLYRLLLPHLLRMVDSSEVLVQCQAVKACCAALRCMGGGDRMDVDGREDVNTLVEGVKEMLCQALGSDRHMSVEVVESVLDGIAACGSSWEGAELLLQRSSHRVVPHVAVLALGRTVGSGVRLAAMHALGSICGSDRAGETSQREAALLSHSAELELRESLYYGTSDALGPMAALWSFIQQPFPDVRQASYRLLVGLCVRTWAASSLAVLPDMMKHILNPSSETTKQLCEWRFAVVGALAATSAAISEQPIENGAAAMTAPLIGAASQIQVALRQGAFGAPGVPQATPAVATEHR